MIRGMVAVNPGSNYSQRACPHMQLSSLARGVGQKLAVARLTDALYLHVLV